tara:strand:+ start:667 stop:834 length:168 start_codon:yes stop_codon:yes gene_type:complete
MKSLFDFSPYFSCANRIRGRGYRAIFTPSPTGDLHLGDLRTPLLSWLLVKINNGE